jgi:hypothetical protein
MLSCKEASQLISEGQDRKLSLRERLGLRLHLWMCDSCRLFEQQLGFLRQTLRRGWSQGDLPTTRRLPSDAQERIRQAITRQRDER